MLHWRFYTMATVLAVSGAQAATYLDTIPGPDDTGGMVMPLVSFNIGAKSIGVSLYQSDTVTMYPLQQYRVWGVQPYADAVFNPDLANTGWYDLLDPTRQHLPFSTQFGFEVVSGNASQLPANTYVYIKATSISDGLKIYDAGYWADVWGGPDGVATWIQAFGEGNFGASIGLDNTIAWGDSTSIKMWHPIALVTEPGLYSARFEIYLGDGYAAPVEGWSSASITLNWQAVAVPEPAAVAVLLAVAATVGGTFVNRRLHKKSRHNPQ